jgi:cell division protease FtsH
VNYSTSEEVFLGKDFSSKKNYSEEIAAEIDQEIRSMIEEAFTRAEEILTANRDKLTLIAETLLDVETLDASQFEALFTGEKTEKDIVDEVGELEGTKKKRAPKREKLLPLTNIAPAEPSKKGDALTVSETE